MANVERLTKRVKEMEDWIKENEMIGGPQGTLETFNFLINEARKATQMATNVQQQFQQLRAFAFEFIQGHKLEKDWDKFLEEKDNAVQKQTTEEVDALTEAEDGKEVGEGDPEGSETTEESEEEVQEETKD